MANCVREIDYRCSDDCRMEGCPGHKGILNYQSVADAYSFSMNGRILHFERGELEAMVSLLGSLSQERADAIKLPRPAPTEAEVEAAAKRAAAANSSMHEGYDLELFWSCLDERAQAHWLRVARAALGEG